jgi:hypothetical protein
MVDGIGLICFEISLAKDTRPLTVISPVEFGILGASSPKEVEEVLIIVFEDWIIQYTMYCVSRLYSR